MTVYPDKRAALVEFETKLSKRHFYHNEESGSLEQDQAAVDATEAEADKYCRAINQDPDLAFILKIWEPTVLLNRGGMVMMQFRNKSELEKGIKALKRLDFVKDVRETFKPSDPRAGRYYDP